MERAERPLEYSCGMTITVAFTFECSCVQDVCGAADPAEQLADVGGPGRLRLLQTTLAHHHGARRSQIYPLLTHSPVSRKNF